MPDPDANHVELLGCTPRMRRWVLRMEGDVERLQATVDKLPVTADNVPVVPGMNVWIRYAGGAGGIRETIVHRIRWGVQRTALLLQGAMDRVPDKVFSTRAAAEVAYSP